MALGAVDALLGAVGHLVALHATATGSAAEAAAAIANSLAVPPLHAAQQPNMSAGADLAGRVSFLSSPTEVAIGIAVAYLGFDRFRYEKRIRAIAIQKARRLVSMDEAYVQALEDNDIDNDEKGIITLYYYGGRDDLRRHLRKEKITQKLKDSDFFNSFCARVMWFLTVGKVDRRAEQVLLAILCTWVVVVTIVLFSFDTAPTWMGWDWVGYIYYTVIALAIGIPGAVFILSEWMLRAIDKRIQRWVRGLEVNIAKRAGEAGIGPAPAPSAGPVPRQPAPAAPAIDAGL